MSRSSLYRLGLTLAAGALAAAPRAALACACQQNPDHLTPTLKLVGAFMLLPFLAAAVVIAVLRSAPRSTQ